MNDETQFEPTPHREQLANSEIARRILDEGRVSGKMAEALRALVEER